MHGFKWYPAQWAAGLAQILAALVAFNFLTQVQASYVASLGLAVIGLATAVMVRPWDVPVMSTAATAVLTALGAFGLKWDDHQIAIVVSILGFIFAHLVHTKVVPKAGSPALLDPVLAPLAGRQPLA